MAFSLSRWLIQTLTQARHDFIMLSGSKTQVSWPPPKKNINKDKWNHYKSNLTPTTMLDSSLKYSEWRQKKGRCHAKTVLTNWFLIRKWSRFKFHLTALNCWVSFLCTIKCDGSIKNIYYYYRKENRKIRNDRLRDNSSLPGKPRCLPSNITRIRIILLALCIFPDKLRTLAGNPKDSPTVPNALTTSKSCLKSEYSNNN